VSDSSDPAHILLVAHETAATPALLEAVRERSERGPCWFHLLVPDPARSEGERVLARAIPLIEQAAHRPVDGSVSLRHDPMDAIEEALRDDAFDEIILSTLPHGISRWLHLDLPRRVAHLGLPVTTVIAEARPRRAPQDG
jgi:hypothetical protein